MSRPCRECGGSGQDPYAPSKVGDVACERCADMPKLPCGNLSCSGAPGEPSPGDPFWGGPCRRCADRRWFRPDPDSVLRWCFKHEHSSGLFWYGGEGINPCDIGWMAKPTRLETVEQ